jgi:hypothetical protein
VHGGEELVRVLTAEPGGALAAAVTDTAEVLDAGIARPAVGDHRGARLDVGGDEHPITSSPNIMSSHPLPPAV